ncbi:hypothetical protein SOASR032_24170 [Pragia fontium]|uniref:SMODS-associated and fused to various effectors domain-containing protein n=1 Tax=Pragia fontium TaxID=82985 RepID=A0ABQ5LMJ9_9GAMM|nr:hypothetical protein [Pragia fontium]GKX63848.1 hypothetical protein SOASR032_24170 [Pragia fontium]
MKTYQKLISTILGKYIILTFILIGCALALIGLLAFDNNSKVSIILTNLGSVIIGGGFFSALTKTKHYTDFFQNRIFDVFFNPANHISKEVLREKWLTLTRSIMRDITNNFNEDGAKKIYDRYLQHQSDYHYSDMQVTYEIELVGDNILAKQIITNKLISTTNTKSLPFKISFTPDITDSSTVELKEVIIDGKKFNEQNIDEFANDLGYKCYSLNLDTSRKKVFNLERTMEYKQNILEDPILLTEYSRFVKGLEVKYKVKNCNVHFLTLGKSHFACGNIKTTVDSSGFTRVSISNPDELTLPWEGFTLIITHLKK